jgi:hypothetical protein
MNIAPVSNHRYSQIIQHKIIPPPACNNVLTESYNSLTEDNSMASSGSDAFVSTRLEDDARTGIVLEGITEGTKEKHECQVANEIRDSEDVTAPENTPTQSLEASAAFPQFECFLQGCGRRFNSQRELIAHMDKESADARKKQQLDDV